MRARNPRPRAFRNHYSCDQFSQFVTETVLQCIESGAIYVWGKVGEVAPSHLVLPMTIEPQWCQVFKRVDGRHPLFPGNAGWRSSLPHEWNWWQVSLWPYFALLWFSTVFWYWMAGVVAGWSYVSLRLEEFPVYIPDCWSVPPREVKTTGNEGYTNPILVMNYHMILIQRVKIWTRKMFRIFNKQDNFNLFIQHFGSK